MFALRLRDGVEPPGDGLREFPGVEGLELVGVVFLTNLPRLVAVEVNVWVAVMIELSEPLSFSRSFSFPFPPLLSSPLAREGGGV